MTKEEAANLHAWGFSSYKASIARRSFVAGADWQKREEASPAKELIKWIEEMENSVFALSAPKNEMDMLSQFKAKIKTLL